MATQKQDGLFTDSGPSGVDLTGKEERFCRRNSSGDIVVCAADERIDGVISEGKAVGLHSSFNTGGGWLRVVSGGVVAIGDPIKSDAEGRGVNGATNAFGIARSASTGAGIIIEVVPDRR